MVKEKTRKALCLALGFLMLFSAFPSSAESPGPTARGAAVHPPRVPPGGQRYDRWQGIVYSSLTAYDVTVSWYLIAGKNPKALEEKHYSRDPDRPAGRFEIVDVRAEPVGGEMRLRSGGYVDVTVRAVFTVNFRYSYDYEQTEEKDESNPWSYLFETYGDEATGIRFGAPVLYPFDMYTGTTLLNYIRKADAESISVMEATDSGLVESRVVWNGRTWRLYARQDRRNTSGGGFGREAQGGRMTVTAPGSTEIIYTFRLPADYDGLALAFPKEVGRETAELTEEDGDRTPVTEVYAEILMGDDGVPADPGDFVFLRLSDLIALFAGDAADE